MKPDLNLSIDELLANASSTKPLGAIARAAGFFPERDALVTRDGKVTYGELLERISAIAAGMKNAGLRRGQVVVICVDRIDRRLLSSLALQSLGCCFSIPFMGETPAQMRGDWFLFDEGKHDHPNVLLLKEDWFSQPSQDNRLRPGFDSEEDRVLQTWTSGTTGSPKCVDTSFGKLKRSIVSSLKHAQTANNLSPTMVAVSLGSLWGYRQALSVLWSGKTLVLSAVDEEAARMIAQHEVKHVVAVSGNMRIWLEIAERQPQLFHSVELVTYGGGPLSSAASSKILKILSKSIHVNYGASEVGLIAAGDVQYRQRYADYAGHILSDMRVEVVGKDGGRVAPGETGAVRVLIGELGKETGNHTPVERWFYTGDEGAIVEENVLLIYGRADGVFNFGGRKFSLDVMEDKLKAYKGLKDVALFTTRDDGVEVLNCAYVPLTNFNLQQFANFFHDIPPGKSMVRVNHIPRSPDGKVQRAKLSEILKASLHRKVP